MNTSEILSHVDHTLLKAFATWEDIQKLCEEAMEYHTASVCVPPSYIKRIHDTYGEKINICTVVGFPLGYSTTKAKVAETVQAIEDGASEVDMVINIADVKNGDFEKVTEEIRSLKQAAGDKILKVIIEACYLTEKEKIAMCKAVTEAGADYIKTSTGFGTGGATMEDILLFKKFIGPHVKMKAAGGVKSVEDMEAFLEAGCDRIGTSSAISLIKGQIPFPRDLITRPSSSNSLIAERMVILLTEYASISSASDGSLSPGFNSPFSIFSFNRFTICLYIGIILSGFMLLFFSILLLHRHNAFCYIIIHYITFIIQCL